MASKPIVQRIQLAGGDDVTRAFKDIGRAAQDTYGQIRTQTERAIPAARGLSEQIGRQSSAFSNLGQTVDQAGQSLLSIRTKMLLLGAAVTGAVAGFVAIAKSAADAAVAQKDAADAAGVTLRSYTQVSRVAQVFGVSAGSIQSAMSDIQRAIADGTKDSRRSFNGFTEVSKGIFRFGSEAENATTQVGQLYKVMERGSVGIFRVATEKTRFEVARLRGELSGTTEGLTEAQRRLNDLAGGLVKAGTAREQIDILQSIAATFDGIRDASKRATLAQEAGLTAVLPLVGAGLKAFKEYRSVLEKLGALNPLSRQEVELAQDFQRVFRTIQLAIKSSTDRTRLAFTAALVDPLKAVLDVMVATASERTVALTAIARSAGSVVADLIRAFTPRQISRDGIVLGIDVDKISEANRWVITLRDGIVSLARQAVDAINRVLLPVWGAVLSAVRVATQAINTFFGTSFGAGELAIGAVLLKLTGLFKLLGGAVVLATGTFGRFAIAVGAAAALLSSTSTQELAKAVQQIKDYFVGAFDEIKGGGSRLESAVKESADALSRYKIKFPEVQRPEVPESRVGQFATLPAPSNEDIASFDKLLSIVREIRSAVVNAYENIRLMFTGASTEGGVLQSVLSGLLDAFNALFGTKFTAGGLAVVAVFLALSGVLPALLVSTAALVSIFGGLLAIFGTSLGIIGSIVRGLAGLTGGAAAAGAGLASFAALAARSFASVLGFIARLVGWPGLLLTGISLLASYWDDVKGIVSSAVDGILSIIGRIGSAIGSAFKSLFGGGGANVDGGRAATDMTVPYEAARDKINGIVTGEIPALVQAGNARIAALYRALAVEVASILSGIQAAIPSIDTSALDTASARVKSAFEALRDAIHEALAVSLPASLSDAFSSIVSTLEALVSRVEALAERAREAANRAVEAARDAANAGGGGGAPFASGGYVRGPGTGTSDSIPAWLSNGEFVVRAAAVRKFGVGFLRAINGLRLDPSQFKLGLPRFAMGGLVDSAARTFIPPSPMLAPAAATLPGKSFDLHIGGETFGGLYAPEQTAAALDRYASSAKTRSAGRKPTWVR